jgi:hypothetical protein
MRRARWSELTETQKALLLTALSVELSLTATAAVDLARRPDDRVVGIKRWWSLALLVQPVGPIVYLWRHRGQ